MSAMENTQLLILEGLISSMSDEDQVKVKAYADQIRTIVGSEKHAMLALALVTAEVAARETGD